MGGPGPVTRLLGTLRARWAQHPLHDAATLALLAGNAAVRPVARRHPVALVLLAAACGAALAWARPWKHVNARPLVVAPSPAVGPALWSVVLTALVPVVLASLSAAPARVSVPWWRQLLHLLLEDSQTTSQRPSGDADERASHPGEEQARAGT